MRRRSLLVLLAVLCAAPAIPAPAVAQVEPQLVYPIAFPLAAPYRLTDSFGDPRAGGTRSHEGVDMMADAKGQEVYAAAGGASTTTSVDLSNTYLDRARRNLARNGLDGPAHRFVRADVRRFLERTEDRWDLVFLDPPTYSRSKAMEGDFDVQRDHVELVDACLRVIDPGGELWFSTNAR